MSQLAMNIAANPGAARPAWAGGKALKVLVSVIPWIIIILLLVSGFLIRPKPVGKSVAPPALERRDRIYGLARLGTDTLVAAGSNGKILSISADGKVAAQVSSVKLSLQDIAAFDSLRAVAVGNDNTIVYTDDGGQQWQQAAGVPRSKVANKLNRVRAGANGFAIALGEMGALFATRDYGKTWTRLREEEDSGWNDVAILSRQTLVVVGEFGRVLRSEDTGATWEEMPETVSSSLTSVSFRDELHGVAVGLEGVVLTTADGGRTWTRADAPVANHIFDVLWNPAKRQWFAVGELGIWLLGQVSAEGIKWESGVLGDRVRSWHTRALMLDGKYWLSGADVGTWDMNARKWQAIKP